MTKIPVALGRALELGSALGVEAINKLPGAWVCVVDERWTIAINGHREEVECKPEGTMGAPVPGFGMAVWWHGWLAGLIGPGGGGLAAHPEGASEDRLIAALEARIVALGVPLVDLEE